LIINRTNKLHGLYRKERRLDIAILYSALIWIVVADTFMGK
jgi:hypothetical protein